MPFSIWDKDKQTELDKYLDSYTDTYLREEILQEGLTRNLSHFTHFLETASLSQGQPLNISSVARECAINRKAAESYFGILKDLIIAYFTPVFTKILDPSVKRDFLHEPFGSKGITKKPRRTQRVRLRFFATFCLQSIRTEIPRLTDGSRKMSKRRMVTHFKFNFFDTGVFCSIRPRGLLATPELIDGPALDGCYSLKSEKDIDSNQ